MRFAGTRETTGIGRCPVKCQNCSKENISDDSKFCPNCGQALQKAPEAGKKVEISSTQDVGSVSGGEVKGVEIGNVSGSVAIESVVNQIEARIIEGQYVDRRAITQNILVLGPEALEQIVKRLAALQGVDKESIQDISKRAIPEYVSQQIVEVVAAQREVAAQGMLTTPQSSYQLGMLAAYNRKYETALGYFRQAVQTDPEYNAAYEAIAWLQQTRANEHISERQYDAAVACLAEAREATLHTDPLDPQALAQRGYIAKTLAQLAEARQQPPERDRYYEEAARTFEQVVKLYPDDPSAHNGLGNVQYARGNLEAAITAYQRAIHLAPNYTAAYHDLALAYEGKIRADPQNGAKWRKEALKAWKKTYELAPQDPAFSPDYILTIGQRIHWLETSGE